MANSSGTTHIVGPLALSQSRKGANVAIFCVEKEGESPVLPDRRVVEGKCFKLSVPLTNPGISIQFARALGARIRDYDVVHIHAIWNFPTWWTMRVCHRNNVPYMVAPQGSLDPWALGQNRLGKRLYGAFSEVPLLQKAARIQALTIKEARQVRQFGIKSEIVVIPNAVSDEPVRPYSKPDPEYFGFPGNCETLLFLSRLHPKKGLENLVDAVQQICDVVPQLRIVVAGSDAGSGYSQAIQKRCEDAGVRDIFQFIGEVKGLEKIRSLTAAHAFILPSVSEGLPIAVLEALHAGLPVIVTDQCNLCEIRAKKAGFVCRSDVSSIANAIVAMFKLTIGERQGLAKNGRELIREKFTWSRIAEQTLGCYQEMLDITHRCQSL